MSGAALARGSRCLLGPRLAQFRGLSVSPRRCPMAITIPSAALVRLAPVFTNTGRLALAGFLAGYIRLTRQAYGLGLRSFARLCQQHQPRLFRARPAGI